MKLFNVKDEYINHLRQFEPKVLFNKNEKRPYVGVVYAIDDFNYYIPLASPKDKFLRMKNSKDFHKINGGKYGAINFNKMIPIMNTELIVLDIEKEEDAKYKNLLRNQYQVLQRMSDIIARKSTNIYALFISTDELTESDRKIKERCCDFRLLEEKMKEYMLYKDTTLTE